jgi:hypothetical protein
MINVCMGIGHIIIVFHKEKGGTEIGKVSGNEAGHAVLKGNVQGEGSESGGNQRETIEYPRVESPPHSQGENSSNVL